MQDLNKAWQGTKDDYVHFFDEIKEECTPPVHPAGYYKELVQTTLKTWLHVPYLPAFHRPGWLMRYLLGPFDAEWLNLFIAGDPHSTLYNNSTYTSMTYQLLSIYTCFFVDFCAGLTVAFTLIPQALSYAQLANLPAINGLYTAILPSTCYVFFGSSMQLAVGPVAVVSLMTGNTPP